MRRFLLILISLFAGLQLSAGPAYPGKIRHVQPDGTVVEIRLHGDEFGHWASDQDGRSVILDKSGFWRVDFGADPQAIRRQGEIRRAAANRARGGQANVAFGEKHFLVILVAFSDVPFTVADTRTAFNRLLNEKGYSENNALGSARDYYYENSRGRFEPVFDVYGPVTVSQTRAYYGKNDSSGNDLRPQEAVAEACQLLDGQIDYTRYDNDGDGNVDMVFMYYAGKAESDTGVPDYIWPHMWYLTNSGVNLSLDGKKLDMYACTSELENSGTLCGIGAACHEFGHTLGLPDLYDTNYTTMGLAGGMYNCSLMDTGCYNKESRVPPYFSFIERTMVGWVDEDDLEEITAAGEYSLSSIEEEKAYRLATDMDGEFFVFECRGSNGWDSGLSGPGLMVYHVDKSENLVPQSSGKKVSAADIWASYSTFMVNLNANGAHPCLYLIPAADPDNLCYGHSYDSFDVAKYGRDLLFPGAKNVTSYTAVSWSEISSELVLDQIKYSAGRVSFTVKYVPFVPNLDYYSIKSPGRGVHASGSNLTLELYEPEGLSYDSVRWFYDGTALPGNSVSAGSSGSHTVTAEILLPGGKRQLVSLEITVE